MWIDMEPNGFMAHINLVFSRLNQAAEDQRVRDYLSEHELAPRRVLEEEHDGRGFEIWQFGECYLGRHLQQVGALHGQGVLSELLGQVVRDEGSVASEEEQDIAWSLAGAVIAANAAVQDKDDPSKLIFDDAFVKTELRRLVAARR